MFNAHTMILIVLIFMNVKNHCLNQKARTRLQTVQVPSYNKPLVIVCILMELLSHAIAKSTKRKCLRISNFPLLLVVFKWHHGNERVKGRTFDRSAFSTDRGPSFLRPQSPTAGYTQKLELVSERRTVRKGHINRSRAFYG